MSRVARRLFTKRTLYLACFMAWNLIEFLHATQAGNVWKAAANCTGLAMMVLIFSALPLRELVDWVNGIYVLVCVCAMAAVHGYWLSHTGEFLWGQAETALLNVCWLGIALRYFFRKAVIEKKISVRPGPDGWLWIALSVLMTFSAGGRWWPLWFLAMFGCFYLTDFPERERSVLWDSMMDGTILSFFAIQIYAYGFRPYDTLRYQGAFANANRMALYYLILYVMCLCRLHVLEWKKAGAGWRLFLWLGAGGMLSFQMFTMCRTALAASFAVTVLYALLVMRGVWKRKWRQILCRGGALLLAAAVTFLPVYYTIRWLPTILHYRIWYEGEYTEGSVHSFDPPDSEKYVDLEECLEALFGRLFRIWKIAGQGDPLALRAYAAGAMGAARLVQVPWVEDMGLRLRLTIYRAYWEDLNWFGHGLTEGHYEIGEEDYVSWHAQNLWLQIAYTYGIPAGVLFLVLSVTLLHARGKNLLRQRENPYALLSFFPLAACMVYGLTEVVWNPGQLILFLAFFTQHPRLTRRGDV